MTASNFQIYKDSYRLFHKILDIHHNLPKEIKYSLGNSIISEIIELMKCIEQFNRFSGQLEKREESLLGAQSHLNLISTFERLCFERAAISFTENSEFVKIITPIEQELAGLLCSAQRQESKLLRQS